MTGHQQDRHQHCRHRCKLHACMYVTEENLAARRMEPAPPPANHWRISPFPCSCNSMHTGTNVPDTCAQPLFQTPSYANCDYCDEGLPFCQCTPGYCNPSPAQRTSSWAAAGAPQCVASTVACSEGCTPGYYLATAVNGNQFCQPCSAGCEQCSSLEVCTACRDGWTTKDLGNGQIECGAFATKNSYFLQVMGCGGEGVG